MRLSGMSEGLCDEQTQRPEYVRFHLAPTVDPWHACDPCPVALASASCLPQVPQNSGCFRFAAH